MITANPSVTMAWASVTSTGALFLFATNMLVMFQHQINEIRKYINFLDEKIARYKKQGRSPERLQENKARAANTIAQLKQAQTGNTKPLQKI